MVIVFLLVYIVFTMLACSNEVWREALSYAAQTGKRDMVKYLLNSEDISKNLLTKVRDLHCIHEVCHFVKFDLLGCF